MKHKYSLFFANAQNKGIVGIFVLVAVLVGAALFLPLPYYQKDDAYCESYPPQLCAKKGWHFGKPLWSQILKTQEKTDSSPVLKQQPTPDLYREPDGSAATANWKIYTNTKYSYSVRYPPEWNVYELVAHRDFEVNSTIESNRVDFAKESQPYPLKNDYWVWVSVVTNTNQLSTEQVVGNYLDGIPEVVGSITKDYLTVSSTNAISLHPVPSATDTKYVYVATKENIYSIVLQAGSLPDLNQEAMNIFNMILSTFKFTSQ